jgi:prepilin-type N-terminal cleavage/methylation domain-containing protein
MSRKAGFTLIELLVVIGIIGILIVALVPLTRGAIVRAKESAVKAQAANIEAALTRFQASHGGYPGVELDVMAPTATTHSATRRSLQAAAAARWMQHPAAW